MHTVLLRNGNDSLLLLLLLLVGISRSAGPDKVMEIVYSVLVNAIRLDCSVEIGRILRYLQCWLSGCTLLGLTFLISLETAVHFSSPVSVSSTPPLTSSSSSGSSSRRTTTFFPLSVSSLLPAAQKSGLYLPIETITNR